MIADSSEIYMSWTITGSNTGVFGELPPTGKRIKISGITRMDFDDEGKIAVEQVYYNELSLMQQLGHTLSPPVLE
jgi:predicted ester cyclase